MKLNILGINLKGGAAKSTNTSIIASYLPESKLIEIDRINESDKKITSKDYESVQLDFMNMNDENFINFENSLLDDGIKIYDIGAVMLEIFHKAMLSSDLYREIDLIVIPAMDGNDDYLVAMSYLATIKDYVDLNKVIFSFNRYNEAEYRDVKTQFSSFFEKTSAIKKNFGIDLNNEKNWYVIKDALSVKEARKQGISLKSLIDIDIDEIIIKQRAAEDSETRSLYTKQRLLAINAKNLYRDYISPMLEKIQAKIEE